MSVPRRLAEQADRQGGRVAVTAVSSTGERAQLTYSDLDIRARAVAIRLRELGVGPERPVAVLMDRGIDLAPVLLGILKAGACYLPLHAGSPARRLSASAQSSPTPRSRSW
jgi:non-ribosomal peptide synthetase component F